MHLLYFLFGSSLLQIPFLNRYTLVLLWLLYILHNILQYVFCNNARVEMIEIKYQSVSYFVLSCLTASIIYYFVILVVLVFAHVYHAQFCSSSLILHIIIFNSHADGAARKISYFFTLRVSLLQVIIETFIKIFTDWWRQPTLYAFSPKWLVNISTKQYWKRKSLLTLGIRYNNLTYVQKMHTACQRVLIRWFCTSVEVTVF